MTTAIARIQLSLLLAMSVCLAGAQQPSGKPAPVRQTPTLQTPAQPTPDKQKGPGEHKSANPCNNNTVKSPSCLPDITNLKGGIIIGGAPGGAGGKFLPWGTKQNGWDLSDLDPLPGSFIPGNPGKCSFNVTYEESNIGPTETGPFYNFWSTLGQGGIGSTIGYSDVQHLNAGETKKVTFKADLVQGISEFNLVLNPWAPPKAQTPESNYQNNTFLVDYYILTCKNSPPKNPPVIPGALPTPGIPPKEHAANPNRPNDSGDRNPNKLPDVTQAKGGIIIGGAVGGAGGKFVPWGGVADLSGLDPIAGTVVGDRCAFNVTYYQTNIGAAGTSPLYTNKLKLDGATDVSINSGQQLNAGETKQVDTQAYLTMGGHGLELSLNDGHVASESNYGNNQFSIRYTLQCHKPPVTVGNCDGLPDLIPILPNPMNGTVMVKNIGKCPAGPSKLTLDCHKATPAGVPGGGCPEVPAAVAAPYHDPMFPDSVTVNVPGLAPGAAFSHSLAFWGSLTWTTGTYSFVGKADAANTVAESNEGNNVVNSVLIVP